MDWLLEPQTWIAFTTLVVLEIVLGVDNVIFISILAGRLPPARQRRARSTGLALAVISRILLLFSLSWVIGLTRPLFTLFAFEISGRDLILILGGLFLIWKSTHEIHHKLEGADARHSAPVAPSFSGVMLQVLVLDLVFSLDSVITAVGMVDSLPVMAAAVVVAAGVMIAAAGPLGEFVERHPSIKMLALAFLLLIGFTLIVEGFHQHISKGYIYFAMAFSIFVELLNLRMKRVAAPVRLREPYRGGDSHAEVCDRA